MRVLVLAPRGRDGSIACGLLTQHGIDCTICEGLAELVTRLDEGAGAVLVTEEALASGEREALAAWVSAQPKWSDLPFVVLANGNKAPRTALAATTLESLGNVVLLERPLHADAMVGALRSALKARRRQYEVRAFADTLERSVAERTQELEAARESLEIALDAADMGSWDLDLTRDSARRTLRHDEIFGYATLQPHWGADIFLRHVVPEDRDRIAAAFDAAARTGTLDIECRVDAADGSRRWIAAKGRVQYDRGGRPVRMTGVVSDITARRETDARLAQAAKMDTIGQLTGGVAHDFNNLLTPIVGNLDLLRRRFADDARAERLIGGALQAAERAATLTQRLLAFARRQTLEPRSVDTGALIDGMLELVHRSLGPSIELVVQVPRHLAAARVDPNQLELALLNLAINARDAMPAGGTLTVAASEVTVEVGNSMGLKPGRFIRIIVADTGTGMDAATMARAIEPFFSTKGLGKGTGLGLSMVHGLAAQSGGALALSSTPGHGTRAEMWLPVATAKASTIAERASAAPAHVDPLHILLVDDEPLVRHATAAMLADMGHHVAEAESGIEALQMLESGATVPDLLVTDYLMPGMNGAELAREARRQRPALPVLVLTGYANLDGLAISDLPLLPKPFREADLAAMIERVVAPVLPTASTRRAAFHIVER
jgi:signal transduction histidine kinase